MTMRRIGTSALCAVLLGQAVAGCATMSDEQQSAGRRTVALLDRLQHPGQILHG